MNSKQDGRRSIQAEFSWKGSNTRKMTYVAGRRRWSSLQQAALRMRVLTAVPLFYIYGYNKIYFSCSGRYFIAIYQITK